MGRWPQEVSTAAVAATVLVILGSVSAAARPGQHAWATSDAAGPSAQDLPALPTWAQVPAATGLPSPAGGGASHRRGETAVQGDAPTGVTGFFRRAAVSGVLDAYYGWSTNGTDPVEFRNFDVTHDRVQFNLAELAIDKKAVPGSRLGFRVDLDGGPTADLVNAFEPGGPDHWKAFQQAYVSVLLPTPATVTVDVGKFVTPLGAEVIEARDNWNYSRSVLFAMAVPYYHFGTRVAYAMTPHVTFTGVLVKGWNAVEDNNDSPTVGVSAALTPSARFTIAQHVMVGAEQPGNDADLRKVFNTVATVVLHPRLSVMADVVVGRDATDGAPKRWHGAAAYLRYQASDRLAISPRYEWYGDPDGYTTGAGQAVQEFTLTGEAKVSDLIARFEVRTDTSDHRSFASVRGPRTSRTTLAVGLMYVFSRSLQ